MKLVIIVQFLMGASISFSSFVPVTIMTYVCV